MAENQREMEECISVLYGIEEKQREMEECMSLGRCTRNR